MSSENKTVFLLQPKNNERETNTTKSPFLNVFYEILKVKFELQILYSETDNLLYQIKIENSYPEIAKKKPFNKHD